MDRKIVAKENLGNIPVYCRQCNSCNSWEREPERDILAESGKVLWQRWTCACGNSTIRPANS